MDSNLFSENQLESTSELDSTFLTNMTPFLRYCFFCSKTRFETFPNELFCFNECFKIFASKALKINSNILRLFA